MRERGNRVGVGRLGGLLLTLAILPSCAQEYCVDHYWVPGTGTRGTAEDSCQMMQPKDGWCGESANNCEGGCAGVWCAATPTDSSTDTITSASITSSDSTTRAANFVGCWPENEIPGWQPWSCEDGATTYYTGCGRMAGSHSERVAHCAQLCMELGYNQFDIHDTSACFCGAELNVASTLPSDETEAEAIAASCMNLLYTIASPCVDVDDGLMGRFSYTCASIGNDVDKCTGYDANGFVAGDMCCQCGGGAIQYQALPQYSLQFGQGQSEYELELNPLGPNAVAGVWTLSAWAMYTADYDGCRKLLHSRWWNGDTILGTTGHSCDGHIGWPSSPDTWERVSETFDTQGVVPSSMHWFVGYSQSNSAGNSYITGLQITGPDGSTWLDDGNFEQSIEIMDIPYSHHQYSSIWSGDPVGAWHGSGRLDSPQAWSAQNNDQNQWMQLTIPEGDVWVAGVATIGRDDLDQWVTSYKVSYRDDGGSWRYVQCGGSECVYTGNHDRNTESRQNFEQAVWTSVVRIHPWTWHVHVSIRAGLLIRSSGHMSTWNEAASYGVYSIARRPQSSCPACITCRAGRYANSTGCSLCGAGSVTNTLDQSGATSCAACPPGQYSESPGQACRACVAGAVTSTLNQSGATSCSACPTGQYSLSPQQACQQCPVGQYSDAPNSTKCRLCSAGGVTDTADRPGASRCDVHRRNCDGRIHCEWVAGPARFLCAVGTSLVDNSYQSLGNWQFEMVGNAYNDGNATLVLTVAQGDQMGLARFMLPESTTLLTQVFIVRFEMYVGDGNGADGMCVNLGDPSPTRRGIAEEGVAVGVSLCFDTHPNSPSEHGVEMFVGGSAVWQKFAECGYNDCYPVTLFEDAQWHSVELRTSPDASGGMNVAFELDGGILNGTAHVDSFEPPSDESWLSFSARTGGATNNHWVRNVAISEGEVHHQPTLNLRSFAAPTCSAPPGHTTGAAGGDIQLPRLAVAFSPDFLCERPLSSPPRSRKVVHAPPDLRAVARVVKKEELERLDGLPHAEAARRVGLSLTCYERVLNAMNDSTANEITEIPLATLPEEFEYVGCGETPPAHGTCLSAGYAADGPESAYWAAILSNQSCLSISNTSGCAEALERLRTKFAGCAGVEDL